MTRDRLFEEARDAFGFDVSSFLGNGLSPEVAEHVEESFAAALSHAAGEPVEVSGARLDGTKIHVNARMSRELAEKLGLVPSIPTFLEFFEALRAARPLLAASAVELTEERLHILCPASAAFDAAEALRLELVAAAPPGVAVDVEIAPSLLGTLSPEDEAGVRLFASQRAERLGTVSIDGGPERPILLCEGEAIEVGEGLTITMGPPPDPDAFPWEVPEGGAR